MINWFWNHYRPKEGWLPLFLLMAAVACLATAVIEAGWTPEVNVAGWTAALGLILGVILAKRPVSWRLALGLHLNYALAVTTIYLARFWPSWGTLWAGWGTATEQIRQNWGLFTDRVGGWLLAVAFGGASQETVVFSFGLGFFTWLLAAYVAWSMFRQQRPLNGLALIGLALALNGYYGNAPLWPATVFIGVAVLLAAAMRYANLEQTWLAGQVDYAEDIRLDFLLHGGGIALALFAMAFVVPAVNASTLSRLVLDRPAVRQAEETLERLFEGVEQSQRGPGAGEGGEGPGATGSLPRSYLLGNPPELQETVVLTATTRPVNLPLATHWRAISYDVYTGRGWATSPERQVQVPAGMPIPLPAAQAQLTVTQSVYWAVGHRVARYSLGLPLNFDHDVTTSWRGVEDLSRVQAAGSDYTVTSQVSIAGPAQLRTASLANVPPALIARYTALPPGIPERVSELAYTVAGDRPTPYDQARALENFLRQYPYTLEVDLPPRNVDPVDFFLFDLQRGYCDYFASAMVVMARSLGLPARLAIGYLAQPPDEQGVQTIYEINAHSWAEVYFAGYGWVEFEPTAAFPVADTTLPVAAGQVSGETAMVEPPPIPEKVTERPSPLWGLFLIALLLFGWWLWHWRRASSMAGDGVVWAYARLQQSARQLGQPTPASQTPAEFRVGLLARLDEIERLDRPASQPFLAPLTTLKGVAIRSIKRQGDIRPEIGRLTDLFILRQYGREQIPAANTAVASWKKIRGPLWLLRLIQQRSAASQWPEG